MGSATTPPRVADRRGEAHLWLAFEDALRAAVGADPQAVADVRRSFRTIADTLSVVGAVDARRAEAVVAELDDALAVRGLLAGEVFRGRPLPPFDAEQHPVPRRGDGWLEAEIEHHLDLVVDLNPSTSPALGSRVLDVLRPSVRALQACGSLPRGDARLADLAATFRAAGFEVDPRVGEVDRGWLGFLTDRPAPVTSTLRPVTSVRTGVELGTVRGRSVTVARVGWSEALLELDVEAPAIHDSLPFTVAWRASVFDDAGRLHLGQAAVRRGGDGPLVFRLRPGLMAGVSSLSVRVTRGSERLEDEVRL